ncbi:hypothetical protein N7517_002693 [Penicillium concentricum]|uniref:Ubiquitin 3 binding protein But2 C-terminal domain-containing protein n=1 Tax=Penicillium concentricum TaxID=293559 RepID=A0A9W9SU99_9EURO|nr:uncharacterized protein N7517_002693 [Penicillium concentricum]KAJ5384782.1 hypothetical protein N7517_002693 [Penicillium concentricum]
MRKFITLAAFAAGSNALVGRSDSCCFRLTSSGGAAGKLGQLGDGQNRIGDNSLQPAQYCIDFNGAITDSSGRGCILTPPTTQLQCDEGVSATPGFSVNSQGKLEYHNSPDFVACATGQNGGLNVYTTPNKLDVTGCVNVQLSADACSNTGTGGGNGASSPAGVPPASSTSPAPVPHCPTSGAPGAPGAPGGGGGGVVGGGGGAPQPSASVPAPSGGTGTKPSGPGPAPGGGGGAPQPGPSPVVPAPGGGGGASQPGLSPSAPAPGGGGGASQPGASPSAPAPGGGGGTKPSGTQPAPGGGGASQPGASPSAPAPGGGGTKPSGTQSTPGGGGGSASQPGASASVPPSGGGGGGISVSVPPISAGGGPPSTGSASASVPATSATSKPSATGTSGGACPTDLSGNYEIPHLIIPVDSSSPSTTAGTGFNGTVSSTKSSLFNFDIPNADAGKTCSLIFLFPKLEDLETSSYSFSGDGKIDFAKLSSTADSSTNFGNMPSVSQDLGIITVSPGNSYLVSTFSCPAGQAVAYEMKNAGSTNFNFFEDWNPSP